MRYTTWCSENFSETTEISNALGDTQSVEYSEVSLIQSHLNVQCRIFRVSNVILANLLEFSVESGQLEGERIRGTGVREKRAARLNVGLSPVLRAESPSARRC